MDELLEAAEAAAREEISKREAYYRDLLQEADLERVEFRRQLEQEKKFFEQGLCAHECPLLLFFDVVTFDSLG